MTDEQAPPAPLAVPATVPASGVATASLVLGIISVLLGLFWVGGWVIGMVAGILGAVAMRRPIANMSTANVGRWLGVAGVVVSLVVSVIRFSATPH